MGDQRGGADGDQPAVGPAGVVEVAADVPDDGGVHDGELGQAGARPLPHHQHVVTQSPGLASPAVHFSNVLY